MDWEFLPNNAVELIWHVNAMRLSSLFRLVCRNWKSEHDRWLTKVRHYVLDENSEKKLTLLSKFPKLKKLHMTLPSDYTFSQKISRFIFQEKIINLTFLHLRLFEVNRDVIKCINTLRSLTSLSIIGLNSNDRSSFYVKKKTIFDISSLLNLTEITLNVLNGEDKILTENFSFLTQLRCLNINCEIYSSKILSKLIHLKKLKCTWVGGTDESIHPICLRGLEEIQLIRSQELSSKDVMSMSSTLKRVILNETHIDSKGIKALSYNTNLETLALIRNDTHYNYVYGFNFELLTSLSHLEFSRNRINKSGMKALSSLIKLKTLIMDRCRIDDTHIEENISKLTNLTFLRLYGNHIQDYDVTKLTILSSLTHLDLSLNKISNLFTQNDYLNEKYLVKMKQLYIQK